MKQKRLTVGQPLNFARNYTEIAQSKTNYWEIRAISRNICHIFGQKVICMSYAMAKCYDTYLLIRYEFNTTQKLHRNKQKKGAEKQFSAPFWSQ